MHLRLNFKSGKPVYLQLVDQVKAAAAAGAIRPGEPLPSIRPLAEELRVNRNTVAKAYAQLESQGVIETVAGKGCFLRKSGSPFRKDIRLKLLAEEIDQAVTAGASPAGQQGRVPPARRGTIRSIRAATRAPTAAMRCHDRLRLRRIETDQLMRRFGHTDAVDGLTPARAARPLLWLLRPQRRRQDDDHQVPAEPAASDQRSRSASSGSTRRATRSP